MVIQDSLFFLILSDSLPTDKLLYSDKRDNCCVFLNLGETIPGIRYLFLALEPKFWETCPLCAPQMIEAVSLMGAAVCPSEKIAQKVYTLSSKISVEYQAKSQAYFFFRYSWIAELLLHIVNAAESMKQEEILDSDIREVIQFLGENYTKKISIDMLSEQFYISKYYLMHRFKKVTGCTIHNFILNKRICYACVLIKSGRTLGEACYLSGFTDYSLFFKSFIKIMGISPSQYSKEIVA